MCVYIYICICIYDLVSLYYFGFSIGKTLKT